jgi:hypothetical protein
MKKISPLHYKQLRRILNFSQLNFETTNELSELSEFIGQQRALEAIKFGIDIKGQGYNLYAMGPAGIGKRSLVSSVLNVNALKKPPPSDWCYIYNFELPEKPVAIALPPGLGLIFHQDMKLFVEEMGANVVAVFESDEYRAGLQSINDFF